MSINSIIHSATSFLLKTWRFVFDLFFAEPNLRLIGWIAIAVVYIGLLMLFTHIDLVISIVNNVENESFFSLAIRKHANLMSLLTNIGLLLFLVIDIMIAYSNKISLTMATIVNVIGILAAVALMIFSLGCHKPQMREIGAIQSELGVFLSWSLFFVSLVVLKTKALTDNNYTV